MTLPLLRDDSLISDPDGVAVRVSLPWIRSLPLTSLRQPIVTIDGVTADEVTVAVGDRRVPPAELTEDDGWWFQQDRVTLVVSHELAAGTHEVAVEFGLSIPYLQVEPGRPADAAVPRRPVARARRVRRARRGSPPGTHRFGGAGRLRRTAPGLGAQRERVQLDSRDDRGRAGCRRHRRRHRRRQPRVARSKRSRDSCGALSRGGAKRMPRSFGDRLTAAGGRVSILGASIDDWSPKGDAPHRRTSASPSSCRRSRSRTSSARAACACRSGRPADRSARIAYCRSCMTRA